MTTGSVSYWTTNHDVGRRRQRQTERRQRVQAEAEEARKRAVKAMARKRGGAISKLYVDAERAQDEIAQAQRETEDRDARRALSEAGELHRQYRDKIVRALGVS